MYSEGKNAVAPYFYNKRERERVLCGTFTLNLSLCVFLRVNSVFTCSSAAFSGAAEHEPCAVVASVPFVRAASWVHVPS